MKKLLFILLLLPSLAFATTQVFPIVGSNSTGMPTSHVDTNGVTYWDSPSSGDYLQFGNGTVTDGDDVWVITEDTFWVGGWYLEGSDGGNQPQMHNVVAQQDNSFVVDGHTIHAYQFNTSGQCTLSCGNPTWGFSPFHATLGGGGSTRVYALVTSSMGALTIDSQASMCSALGVSCGGGGYASTTIDNFIVNSKTNFQDTTGFDITGVIQWAGENLIKVFLGMMFLILYNIRYWIIVLLVLGGIIAFSIRAFKFFRH